MDLPEDEGETNEWKKKYHDLLKLRTTDAEKALQDFIESQAKNDALLVEFTAHTTKSEKMENEKWKELSSLLEEIKESLKNASLASPSILAAVKKELDALKSDIGSQIQRGTSRRSDDTKYVKTLQEIKQLTESLDLLKSNTQKIYTTIPSSGNLKQIVSSVDSLKKEIQALKKDTSEKKISQTVIDALKKEISLLQRHLSKPSESLQPQSTASNESANVESRNIISLMSLCCGISIDKVEYTPPKTIYTCTSKGRQGIFLYTLTIEKAQPKPVRKGQRNTATKDTNDELYENWGEFDIEYNPINNKDNSKTFAKLPEYFQEVISFKSSAVSDNFFFFFSFSESF